MPGAFIETIPFLKQRSISSTIVDLVIQRLLSGDLKPGDKLPTELEFAEKLGVGRNAVREAMQFFATLGIVDIRRGSGTYVAETMSASMVNTMILSLVFEQKTPQALIELRLLFDQGAGELIIEKASDEQIDLLDAANERLRREATSQAPRIRVMADLDSAFHHTYYELSGNALLSKIATAVYALFRASMEKALSEDPMLGYRNHCLQIDAVRKRDSALLKRNLHASLTLWKQRVSNNRDLDSA